MRLVSRASSDKWFVEQTARCGAPRTMGISILQRMVADNLIPISGKRLPVHRGFPYAAVLRSEMRVSMRFLKSTEQELPAKTPAHAEMAEPPYATFSEMFH